MGLSAAQAAALGLVQGPAELLPISSAAHSELIPLLLRWEYAELDAGLRKSFEVALHAGSAVGLLIAGRRKGGPTLHGLDRHRLLVIAAGSAPPALAGYAFEDAIEARLGTPAAIAVALLGGSAAMILADRGEERRLAEEARARDGLALGLAQACALIPGVSRSGATLATGRLLGFRAADARLLSEQVALPVLVGALLLRMLRLRRAGLDPQLRGPFATGTIASFASTLVSAVSMRGRSPERLAPFAVYRALLAVWLLIRLARGSTARR